MKYAAGLISAAVAIAVCLPTPGAAQMMQGSMMGGGRHGMINLVSPADSPIQIRRGSIMIGSYVFGMMGQNSMRPELGPGSGTPSVRVVLRLYGVSDPNGLVTSTGNHLIFEGQLTTAGNRVPINIDQLFALNAGSALVQASLGMSAVNGPATITIDRITVQDSGENAFAVPGVNLARPTPQSTPGPTPGRSCTTNGDCNDGDPNTADICTPMGCQHMSGHMGPGMSSP